MDGGTKDYKEDFVGCRGMIEHKEIKTKNCTGLFWGIDVNLFHSQMYLRTVTWFRMTLCLFYL